MTQEPRRQSKRIAESGTGGVLETVKALLPKPRRAPAAAKKPAPLVEPEQPQLAREPAAPQTPLEKELHRVYIYIYIYIHIYIGAVCANLETQLFTSHHFVRNTNHTNALKSIQTININCPCRCGEGLSVLLSSSKVATKT
jgi:hypothetical protein